MSEQLDAMKSSLMAIAQSRMSDLEHTDAEELGEVIDMIKDLEEAKYYCSITKAMMDRTKDQESQDKIDNALLMERIRNQSSNNSYYGGPYLRYPDRDFDEYGRMYYDGRDERRGSSNPNTERAYTMPTIRDYREGKSPISRKGYVESKDTHMDKPYRMERLNEYVKMLGEDLSEMIMDASPEEKKQLHDELVSIAQKMV